MDDAHARRLLSQHRDRLEHELARLRRDDDDARKEIVPWAERTVEEEARIPR